MKSFTRRMMRVRLALLMLLALPAAGAYGQWAQAAFEVSDDTLYLCGGSTASVQFTNISYDVPANATYYWTFLPNGATSTLTNPTITFTAAGTYTARLEIRQGNSVISFLNRTIVVYNPVASFTVNQNSGCQGGTNFQFTNQPILADSFVWNFAGDGFAINQNNPSHIFNSPNPNATISLLLYVDGFANACASSYQTINVQPQPIASVTANPLTSCQQGEQIQFINNSFNAVTHYWNFGDGGTSTAQAPTHIFNTVGNHTVTYIATGSGGCTDTATVTVYTGPAVPMNITVASQTGCSPYTVTFTPTQITGVQSYIWDFGDGTPAQTLYTQTATHTYYNNGTTPVSFNVSVTAFIANGSTCNSSVTLNNFITVNPLPQASFVAPAGASCVNSDVTFLNTSQGAVSYNWTLGNSGTSTDANPTTSYSIPGYFNVSLIATNQYGCKDTAAVDSAVHVPDMHADFQATTTTGCSVNAQFINFSTGATTFEWDFGDGSPHSFQAAPTHLYTIPGYYTVTLIVRNGACADTLVQVNYINVTYSSPNYTPPAPFNGCVGIASTFDANNPNGTGFIWDFGDNSPLGSGPNPEHTYTAPGTYTVSLITTTNTGCQEMIPNFATIIVDGGEPVVITENISCSAPYTVNFSTPTQGLTYFWSFGDSTTSTSQNTSHVYAADGFYNVGLTIITPGGCVATYNGINHLALFPFQAGYESSCTPVGSQFFAQFSPVPGNATSVQWFFSDGQSSAAAMPTMAFDTANAPISFTAIIQTQYGCIDTITGVACADQEINLPAGLVFGSPPDTSGANANAIWIRECAPYNITFNNQFLSADSVKWYFGDGATSTDFEPTHEYLSPGTYFIHTEVWDNDTLTTWWQPYVLDIGGHTPMIQITQQNFCDSIVALFTGVSPGATSWLWTLSDVNYTSTLPSFSYTYAATNQTYHVQLTTIDAEGCAGSATSSVYAPMQDPEFTLDTLLCNAPLVITHDIDTTFSFQWSFGDGTYSSDPYPVHNYANVGTYNVSLHLLDALGCPHDYPVNEVGVYRPTASFTADKHTGCAPLTVTFNSTSTGTTAGNSHYWFFTQNSYLNNNGLQPVTYTFDQPGVYPIKLTVFNVDGYNCSGSYYDTIRVYNPAAGFTAVQNKACIQPTMTVTFTDTSTNAVAWNWSFGDGATSTLQNPVHQYTSMPTDSVRLTITTADGCTASTVRWPFRFFDAAITTGDDTLCLGQTGSYVVQSNGMMFNPSWHWGDNTANTNYPSAQHTYANPGNYNVTCYLTANDGCRDTLILPVWIVEPVVSFHSNTPAACAPSNVVFNNTSQAPAGSVYVWDFGDGTSITNNFPIVIKTYTTPGIYTVKLKVTTPQGCVDSLVYNDYVTVLGPTADFVVSSGFGCLGDTLHFINLSTNVSSFKWIFGDGTTDTLNYHAAHVYDSLGSYNITLMTYDSLGCNSNKTLPALFDVYAKPVAGMNIDAPYGCAPYLPIYYNWSTGGSVYTWDFGNGDFSNDSIPNYTFPNAGEFDAKLIVTTPQGCMDTAYKHVSVYSVPVADFNISFIDSTCEQLTLVFHNNSIADTAVVYKWTCMEANLFSDAFEPANLTLDSTGTYMFTLSVINSLTGCMDIDTLTLNINVPGYPIGSLTTPDSIGCGQVTANFSLWSQAANNMILNYGDGTSAANSNINPQHTYSQPGTYTPFLILSNQFGCVDTVYGNPITVIPFPVADFVAVEPKSCEAFMPQFVNNSSALVNPTYSWNFGNGQVSTDSLPTGITYVDAQAYDVTLIVTNASGCADTLVRPAYIVIADTIPPPTVPINRVTVLSETAVKVEWAATSAFDFDAYRIYREQNGTYQLVATVTNVNQTSFIETGLSTLSNAYCYKVQIQDNCGNSMALDSLKEQCSINVTASTLQDEHRLVKWTPYGGCSVDYYEVYRTAANAWNDTTTAFLIGTVPGTETTYVDSGRVCPREYKYRIKAVSLCGNPFYSMSDTASTYMKNGSSIAMGSNVTRSTVVDNQFVRTEWKAPVIPELISYYTVYRSDDSTNYNSIGQVTGPFTAIDTVFSYDDFDAPFQTMKSYYRIETTSQCDNKTSVGTTGDNIVLEIINDPASYSATLKWTPYVSWGPNGVNYYKIEYQDDSGQWHVLDLPQPQYPGDQIDGNMPTEYTAPY